MLRCRCGQSLLDLGLTGQEPIQGLVEVVFGGVGYVQFVGQGGGVPEPGSGQFGARMQETFGDHGHHEVALGAGLGGEQRIEAEATHGAEHGLDVTVGEGAVDLEGGEVGRNFSPASERRIRSMRCGGRWEMLPRVSCLT